MADAVDEDIDVEMDLERSELAELLDRAMAYLPPETRQLLLQRYIEDLSSADIAWRMRISAGAVAVRLHRGRLALRRVLTTDLREEAASYGLLSAGREIWEATRIWCPTCGEARLEAFRSIEDRTFLLRCPGCRSQTSDHSATYLGEVRGHTRTMVRSNREAHTFYRAAIEAGEAPCCICGRSLPLLKGLPDPYAGTLDRAHGVQLRCARCDIVSFQPVTGLALASPVVERFWRKHRRVRTLPVRESEVAGRTALEATFQSVTDSAYVTVVTAADTFEVIDIRTNDVLRSEDQA
jgi:RNA polymerase sigma-70 factor (ECF subfamily)